MHLAAKLPNLKIVELLVEKGGQQFEPVAQSPYMYFVAVTHMSGANVLQSTKYSRSYLGFDKTARQLVPRHAHQLFEADSIRKYLQECVQSFSLKVCVAATASPACC